MKLRKILAANLKDRRGNQSQETFARKLGISRATLTRIENASQNITIDTLERIASALRCDASELLKRSNGKRS